MYKEDETDGSCSTHGEMKNVYKILVGKPDRKSPLGRTRRRCEDNIRIDLREIGWEDVDWIHLAQN